MSLPLFKLGLSESSFTNSFARSSHRPPPFLSPRCEISWMNIGSCASRLTLSRGFPWHLEWDPVPSPWQARPSTVWLGLFQPRLPWVPALSQPGYSISGIPNLQQTLAATLRPQEIPADHHIFRFFSILNNSEESGWVFFVHISIPIYILV